MRRLAAFATLLMLACSGKEAWKVEGAPKVPPDFQYRTGVEAGGDVWLWTCYEGHHVAITKFSSACFAGAPRLQQGPCGQPFDWEETERLKRSLGEMPASIRWPRSDAGPPPQPEYEAEQAARARDASPAPSASSPSSPAP